VSPTRILFVAWFTLVPQLVLAQAKRMNELRLHASCGELRLTVQAENAVRVRCGSEDGTKEPELIFTSPAPKVSGSIGSDARSSWLKTSQIKAIVDKRSGNIRFLDAKGKLLTEELPEGRQLTRPTGSDSSLKVAEDQFALQPAEHLYGSGQFCVWQVVLGHFGRLLWPTLGTLSFRG